MLDICHKLDINRKITYCCFNTGLEYKANMRHLDDLEEKYGIHIHRIRPQIPVPLAVKCYGQPFLDKNTSENMQRLQKVDFQWEDKDFDTLVAQYCREYPREKATTKNGSIKRGYVLHNGKYYRGAYNALAWWCNEKGENSRFNIGQMKHLKEFIIANPPQFKISNKCCYYSKKKIIAKLIVGEIEELGSFDLIISGTRKYEGGCRKTAYANCITPDKTKKYKGKSLMYSEYRPIFFYKQTDKREYMEHCNVECSIYEPDMYIAACNLFKDSYEYMRMYKKFREIC